MTKAYGPSYIVGRPRAEISARCLRSSVIFGSATWALIFGVIWLVRWCLS